jgi:hypothetical protein
MVVLHCNGRTCGKAYLITFKVGPLRIHTHTHRHTHLLYRSCHYWKHRRKASFGIFRSLAVAFDLMSTMVAKRVPLRPTSRLVRNCCTTWDVWLAALSIIVMQKQLLLPLVAPLPQNCIVQPLQNLHVGKISNTVQAVRIHGAPNRWCQGIPGTFWMSLVFKLWLYSGLCRFSDSLLFFLKTRNKNLCLFTM